MASPPTAAAVALAPLSEDRVADVDYIWAKCKAIGHWEAGELLLQLLKAGILDEGDLLHSSLARLAEKATGVNPGEVMTMLLSFKTFVEKMEEHACGDHEQLATGWKVTAFKLFIHNYQVCSAHSPVVRNHHSTTVVASCQAAYDHQYDTMMIQLCMLVACAQNGTQNDTRAQTNDAASPVGQVHHWQHITLWLCSASDHDYCHALHQQASKPIGFTLQQVPLSSQAEAAAAAAASAPAATAATATAAAPSAAAATAAATEPEGDRSCTHDTIPTDQTHKAPPSQHSAESVLLKYHTQAHRWQPNSPLILELLQIIHHHICPNCLMNRDITSEEFVCHLDPAFDEPSSGEEEEEEDAPPMPVPVPADEPLPALLDATAQAAPLQQLPGPATPGKRRSGSHRRRGGCTEAPCPTVVAGSTRSTPLKPPLESPAN
jgi:hypothetical protein